MKPTHNELLQTAYDRTQPRKKARASQDVTDRCQPYLDAAQRELQERKPDGFVGHQLAGNAYNRIKYPDFYDDNLDRIDPPSV